MHVSWPREAFQTSRPCLFTVCLVEPEESFMWMWAFLFQTAYAWNISSASNLTEAHIALGPNSKPYESFKVPLRPLRPKFWDFNIMSLRFVCPNANWWNLFYACLLVKFETFCATFFYTIFQSLLILFQGALLLLKEMSHQPSIGTRGFCSSMLFFGSGSQEPFAFGLQWICRYLCQPPCF